MKGTLYGLGVGPGNSDLVPIGAVRKLAEVDVVFAASSPKNDFSHALNVVDEFLPDGVDVRYLDFPMTRDQAVLEAAWNENARMVLEVLDAGKDAAFITIGDSLLFSTWSYLMATVKEHDENAQLVSFSGVPAYHAAASCLNLPLVEGSETLLVFPGVKDLEHFVEMGNSVDTLVVMKAYKNFDQLLDAVSQMKGKHRVIAASNVGLKNEAIVEDAFTLRGTKMPYLTMLIVKSVK
ncbi:MAG: precorrin-2 C(20)-methyltransferase [Desulfovibrio sp.]